MFRRKRYLEPVLQLCGKKDHKVDGVPVRVIEQVHAGDDPEPHGARPGFLQKLPECGFMRLLPRLDAPGHKLPGARVERIIRGTADEEVFSTVPPDPERAHLDNP